MPDNISVNIGLLGHIDHGKTQVARALSEIVSTAGLDKHPQAQERGISIDLGFTSFHLNGYLVTLVDAPGHAELIHSVVAGANIIDAAILVVAADEGPKIQTGEHIIILQSFGISKVVVALNKVDLVSPSKLETVKNQIKDVLKGTILEEAPIIPVSATTGAGMEDLKKALLSILSPPRRETGGYFKMSIDHAFHVKGAGTVLTGTIHRGKIHVGDEIEIMPIKLSAKVRSIQTFRESRDEAQAGDRVGISITRTEPVKIYRGCYAGTPGTLNVTDKLIGCIRMNKLFKYPLSLGVRVHLTVGMPTVTATVIPFRRFEGKNLLIEEVGGGETFCALFRLSESVVAEEGTPLLVSRLDLPPTILRIAGSGKVTNPAPGEMEFFTEKTKSGRVKTPVHPKGSIVVGLAETVYGAEKLLNETAITEKGTLGRVVSTFGGKGAVIIKFEKPVSEEETVFIRKYKPRKI
ncbi:MAG: selenocysteine-specific translation elongation factor [Candidatus Jordarchaeaceae archaeon]